MYNPKVSIVIPVYEPTEYFSAALESLTIQTYKGFEVVVSDDTNTSEKAKLIIQQFPELYIKYVRNRTGQGIFNNLNNAIQNSTGEFIQIFCQDDVMLSFFLEKQLATHRKFPSAGLIFSRFLDTDFSGEIIPTPLYKEEAITTWRHFLPMKTAFNYLFAFGCIPGNLSPVMLTRDVIKNIGLFNEDFKFSGDYEYWIRVASRFNFAFNAEPCLYVRAHNNRASNTIGITRLIPDSSTLYRYLYNNNTINATKFKKKAQVNNLVVGYFKEIILNLLKGRVTYFKLFKYLNIYPFRIYIIIILIFHRYIKGKVTWFISESEC